MKKMVRCFVKLITPILCGLFVCAAVIGTLTPDSMTTAAPEQEELFGSLPLSLHFEETVPAAADTAEQESPSLKAQLMLLGFFPVKEVNVTLSDHRQVYVGGEAFGLEIPTGTDAGDYIVYYRAAGEEAAQVSSLTVTISKADVIFTAPSAVE